MRNNQTKLLVEDNEDEVTTPGSAYQPTKLLSIEEDEGFDSDSESERYYRELSRALDEALNL